MHAQTAQELAYIELRRRVWATCVIMDRWYGAALGIPLLIDLLDCDMLLPAPYDVPLDLRTNPWPTEPSFMALCEHLKLSILIGRVLKIIYSPTGLKHATDDQLQSLLADMTAWLEDLPIELQYHGSDSSLLAGTSRPSFDRKALTIAGFLHMNYAAMQFLFWRVFMRITYTCPPHLTVRLDVRRWNQLVQWSQEAIEWLRQHDYALDSIFIFSYTATSCALMQYHTWARRRDPAALENLWIVKDIAMKWESVVQPDQMSIRRKNCETMTLLYEAALKTNPFSAGDYLDRPLPVNPTAGVRPRESLGRAVFVRDPTRPQGGVWVAETEQDREASGLVREECVLVSDLPEQSILDEMKSEAAAQRPESPQYFRALPKGANVNPQMNIADLMGNDQEVAAFEVSVFGVLLM